MAEFDPDAYLASKRASAPSAEGFDPDAYLAKKKGEEKMGAGKAGLLGIAQGGTFGFVDEIGGALGKMFVPESGVRLGSAAQFAEDDTQEVADAKMDLLRQSRAQPTAYELVRDRVRADQKKAQADQGAAYATGEVGAALASSVLMPAGVLGAAGRGGTTAARFGKAARAGAGIGAAYGAGSSEADAVGGVALDTALGGTLGAAGGVLGQGAGELARKVVAEPLARTAAKRLARADVGLDDLAQKRVLKDIATASGELGAATQSGNRLVENLLRLETTGGLNQQQAGLLRQLRADGTLQKLQEKLASSALDDLPGKAAEIEARQGVLAGMQGDRSQLFARAREAAADPMAQLRPRIQRYAAPVASALLGPSVGGVAGAVAGGGIPEMLGGALAGAGIRPAIHATRRMLTHPATQSALWSRVQHLVQTNPAALGKYAKPLATAAAKGQQQFATTNYVLAQRDPEYREMMSALTDD
jgi:hypothetical protein